MTDMTMNIYVVYADDGDDYGENVYKLFIPGFDEDHVKGYLGKYNVGYIVKIQELEKPFISNEKVISALRNGGFGKFETDIISRALSIIDIAQ